jgi:hypothetical protein
MKNIIFSIFGLLIITGLLTSQTKWTDITYSYQTGPIPPPYFYHYNFIINSGGVGTLVYQPDYPDTETWVYTIKLCDEDIKQVDEAITKSKILDETIPALADSLRPVGGSLEKVTVMLVQDPNLDQMPHSIVTPEFPKKEYKEQLDELYSVIKNLIPQSTWDEINARKDEFIKNYKQ